MRTREIVLWLFNNFWEDEIENGWLSGIATVKASVKTCLAEFVFATMVFLPY